MKHLETSLYVEKKVTVTFEQTSYLASLTVVNQNPTYIFVHLTV